MERAMDGEPRIYLLRPILARYLIDEGGMYIPQAAAMKRLAKLPLDEFLDDVFKPFFEALNETAVPNVSGNSLSLRSEVEAAQPSEFPTG